MQQAEVNKALLRARALLAAKEYKDNHPREFWEGSQWYGWQHEGFETDRPQTMLMAGNRTGKTMSAGYHTAVDLTGDYPDWWKGERFKHGINALVMGVDNQQLKDVVQKELFGDVYEDDGRRRFTGGWVHPDEIGRVEWSPVLSGLARRVEVLGKHGMANCTLRAYSQAKTGVKSLSFAGTSIDLIWVDECPPDDLVGQLVTRTMTGNYGKGGRIRYTMTPELGATNLVAGFMEDRKQSQKLIGPIPWSECPHLTPEVQATILENIPEHERDMRSKGVPHFGSGLVYPVAMERLAVDPFPLEKRPWLKYIRAIDLGVHHPTAICWLAYDAEDDTIYLLKTYSCKGEAAPYHAAQANSYLPYAPMVFPHDVDVTEKGSGKTVREYYEEAGINNGIDFQNPDGSIKVEPGIMHLLERMRSGKFKYVRGQCTEFEREFRMYHRDNGKIVKEYDDCLDAMRYGAIMVPEWGVTADQHLRKPRVVPAMGAKW